MRKVFRSVLFIVFFFFLSAPRVLADSVSSTITIGNNDSSLIGSTFNNSSTTNPLGRNLTSGANVLQAFSNITVPKNATITSAYMDFGLSGSGGDIINVKIAAQNSANATIPTSPATFNTILANLTPQTVLWNNVPHGVWGSVITSPNISPVIQAIVNRSDWVSGNAINISIVDNGSVNYANDLFFTANFTGAGQKPRLTIVYNPTITPTPTPTPTPTVTPTPTPTATPTPTILPTPTPTPTATPMPTQTPTSTPTSTPTPTPTPTPVGGATTVVSTLIAPANDTQLIGTTFSANSNIITIGKDLTNSAYAFNLFSNLAVPQGSTITNATLTYELTNSGGNAINAKIAAEATALPTPPTTLTQFTTKQSNLTVASVNWSNVPHGVWGTQISSPNIAPVIQEIVNRSDWQSGNSMQLWIGDNNSGVYSGATYLTADFTGVGLRPTLSISYVLSGATPTPTSTPIPTATPTPTLLPTPTPTPVSGATIVTIPVTYGSTSDIYYKELTLVAKVGTVSSAAVYANGSLIPSTYDSVSGNLVFSTSANQIDLQLTGVTNPSGITVTKAPLKNNKKWAWSMSFDDNVYLKASVDALSALGYRATFYLIGNIVDPIRDESWIVDKPYLVQKLNQGWSIGNHTWDHECTTPNVGTVTQGFAVDKDIVNSSQVLGYKVIAFAAPCYAPDYASIISTMRANGQNEVKFNETGGTGIMIINPGATAYTSGATTADVADSTTVNIGRDAEIDYAPDNVKGVMTWMSTNAATNRNFWLNTYLHGQKEVNMADVANFAYSNYGLGGANEMWMAPADEVYSYFIVRDNATIGSLQIH